MLAFLNFCLFGAHNALILLNMFGWAFRRTQVIHLVALLATLFSWFVMGIWRGFGYCMCTDWHFQIRREMGIHQGEVSYIELLLNQIPSVTVSRQFADRLVLSVMVLILVATTIVWTKRLRKPQTA